MGVPLRCRLCLGLGLTAVVVAAACGAAPAAADHEDIVLASQVAARIRHPGPFDSITQRAAKVNQNINNAFAREDVGRPQMSLREEAGLWAIYIGKTRLLCVFPEDAGPNGKTAKQLASIWLGNFARLFPLAEPVIHMDDPFGQGSNGPRGPGHQVPGDPTQPPPPRHDEDLPTDVRLILAGFDEARTFEATTAETIREKAADVLDRLGFAGPEARLQHAQEALEAALFGVCNLSKYQFEVKRVKWAELALKRVMERLGLRRDLAQAPGAPAPPPAALPEPPPTDAAAYDLRYRPVVGQKAAARLSLRGPAKLLDAAGNQLFAMEGALAVDLVSEVTEIREDSFLLSLQFSNTRLTINGADTPVEQHRGEVVLAMDPHGHVLATELKAMEGKAPLAALGVQVAPRLLSLVRFKGEPVAVGETWVFEEELTDGDRTLRASCANTLLLVDDGVATVSETGTLDLPATELSFGGIKIPVHEGSVSLSELQRQVDLTTGATRSAQGKLAVDLRGEREGIKLTMKAEFDVLMEPAEA